MQMKALCLMTEGCRHEALLQVFGDSLPGHRCGGLCDLCSEAVSTHAILPRRPGLEPAEDGVKKRGGGGAGARGRGGRRKRGAAGGSGAGAVAKKGGGGNRFGGRGGGFRRGRKKS